MESIIALSLMASVVSFALLLQSRVFSSSLSDDRIEAWRMSEQCIVHFKNTGELSEVPADWDVEEVITEQANGVYRLELEYRKAKRPVYERTIYLSRE